jgi:hypothetical protein
MRAQKLWSGSGSTRVEAAVFVMKGTQGVPKLEGSRQVVYTN